MFCASFQVPVDVAFAEPPAVSEVRLNTMDSTLQMVSIARWMVLNIMCLQVGKEEGGGGEVEVPAAKRARPG